MIPFIQSPWLFYSGQPKKIRNLFDITWLFGVFNYSVIMQGSRFLFPRIVQWFSMSDAKPFSQILGKKALRCRWRLGFTADSRAPYSGGGIPLKSNRPIAPPD